MITGFYIADFISSRFSRENLKYNSGLINPGIIQKNVKMSKYTIFTVATMDWLMHTRHSTKRFVGVLKKYFEKYPDQTPTIYGSGIAYWLKNKPETNRIDYEATCSVWCSLAGYACNNMRELKRIINRLCRASHNSESSLRAAEIGAILVYMCKKSVKKEKMIKYFEQHYNYTPCDDINSFVKNFKFSTSAKVNMNAILNCFFKTDSFIEALSMAINLRENCDLISCMTAMAAEAYYGGVPKPLVNSYKLNLPEEFVDIIVEFDDYVKTQNPKKTPKKRKSKKTKNKSKKTS